MRAVRETVRAMRPFAFELTSVQSFPDDAVYLAPDPSDPSDPFVALTEGLWRTFPDYPPYGGQFETVIPHLTVGLQGMGASLDTIALELSNDLPIRSVARELTLLVEENDGWVKAGVFPFTS